MFRNRFDRILARIVGGGLFLLGIGELIARLDDPLPLFYWLPTLWGGAVLVLVGSFYVQREKLSKVLVILGAVLGLSPSAWTVVMPVLMITLVIRTIMSEPAPSRYKSSLTASRRARPAFRRYPKFVAHWSTLSFRSRWLGASPRAALGRPGLEDTSLVTGHDT